ncbi:MAG TPA: tetratricopeptide repeat protein, partial [Candidatus Sulfomarinibacteraceae bacterium]|nr:tetratricopeptide repeat protein [Candidatus Sulfomarinibacteraceae bacterium]
VVARRAGPQRAFACLAAAAVAGAAVLAPSTVRNARVSGHLVPVSANGGITLYNGNNPQATGVTSSAFGEAGYFASPWHGADVVARASVREGRRVDYVEASRAAGREAIRWMAANPAEALRLVGRRALLFWGPDEIAHSTPVAADRAASPLLHRAPFGFAAILAGAIWAPAAWSLARRRSAVPAMPRSTAATLAAVALMVATWFASFLPFLASSLYRMTVVPGLLLTAAVGVAATLRLAWSGAAPAAGLLAAALAALWLILRVPVIPVDAGSTERLVQRGAQWRAQGELARAEAELRDALRSDPGSQRAANGLAAVLLDQRRFAEAQAVLQPATAAGADDPALHFNLGLARVGTGDWAGAVTPLRAAVELAPNLVEARVLLASAHERLGDRAAAVAAYEAALVLAPDRVDVANNLAWLLATAPEARLRDGPRAVELATSAVSSMRAPATLDTLAAALAEAGRFDEAVAVLEEALRIAGGVNSPTTGDLEARLRGYRAGRPHRSP